MALAIEKWITGSGFMRQQTPVGKQQPPEQRKNRDATKPKRRKRERRTR